MGDLNPNDLGVTQCWQYNVAQHACLHKRNKASNFICSHISSLKADSQSLNATLLLNVQILLLQ